MIRAKPLSSPDWVSPSWGEPSASPHLRMRFFVPNPRSRPVSIDTVALLSSGTVITRLPPLKRPSTSEDITAIPSHRDPANGHQQVASFR